MNSVDLKLSHFHKISINEFRNNCFEISTLFNSKYLVGMKCINRDFEPFLSKEVQKENNNYVI